MSDERPEVEIDEKLYREIIEGTNEDPEDVEVVEDEVVEPEEDIENSEEVEDEEQELPEPEEAREEAGEADTPEQEEEDTGDTEDGEESEVEKLRKEVERLKQANMSISGRASKAARELNALKAEREKLSTLTGMSTEDLSKLDDKSLEEIKADYNVDLKAINSLIDEHQALKSAFTNTLTQYESDISELRNQIETQRVLTIVKDRYHNDIVDILESEEFDKWRDALPPDDNLYVRTTNNPKEIGDIVSLFKEQTGWNKQRDTVPRDTLKRRKKREKSSVGAKSRSVATKVGSKGRGMLDEKAIYEEVYGRIYG